MTTEIAIRDNGVVADRDVVDGWLAVASDVIKLANHIADTDFVPEVYRGNPPAVAAAILAGRELNLGPMTSLRHVQVVKGSPSLSAEYKRARVLAAGHEFDVVELNTERCRVSGRRRGSTKPPLEITYTMEDAKRAGLLAPSKSGRPGAWQMRPRRMLFARAGSELCDFLFADVVNGLPTAELLSAGANEDGFDGYDESPAQAAPKTTAEQAAPKPRTAQRRTRQAPAQQSGQTTAPDQPNQNDSARQEPDRPAFPEDEQHAGTQEPDHDSPGTATVGKGGQLTALWTILKTEFGFSEHEKAQARSVCEEVIGRKLAGETTGDLSYNEARTVLDTLASWKAVAESDGNVEPREVMVTMLAQLAESRGPAQDGGGDE